MEITKNVFIDAYNKHPQHPTIKWMIIFTNKLFPFAIIIPILSFFASIIMNFWFKEYAKYSMYGYSVLFIWSIFTLVWHLIEKIRLNKIRKNLNISKSQFIFFAKCWL
jgi:cellulose synthase/poly-beta-1,6-N-acetylglucosamine synthase-like glycosyltransferase